MPFPPLWPRNEQCPLHIVKHGDFTLCGAIVAARIRPPFGGEPQPIHFTE